MHFSFIRPVLEYGGIIWDNCTKKKDNSHIESIQIEAMIIVTGTVLTCTGNPKKTQGKCTRSKSISSKVNTKSDALH